MTKPAGYSSVTISADGETVANAAIDATRPPAPLATRSLADMLADPRLKAEIRYLLAGMIPRGGTTLLYGRGKSGKSTYCHHLALAVTRGTPFHGRDVAHGPVLWIDLEQGERLWTHNFAQAGATADDLADATVHYVGGPLACDDTVASVFATIDAVNPVLTVIDSAVRWLKPPDENDNGWWAAAMDPIVRHAQQRDGAVLIVDHGRKGGGNHGDALRGGGAKLDAVDCAIYLYRQDESDGARRRLDMVSRYDGDQHHLVELTADGYVEVDRRAALASDDVLAAVDAGAGTVAEVHAHLTDAGHEVSADWVRKRLKAAASEGMLEASARSPRHGGHRYARPGDAHSTVTL